MKKKLITLIAVTALTAGMIAGCGKDTEAVTEATPAVTEEADVTEEPEATPEPEVTEEPTPEEEEPEAEETDDLSAETYTLEFYQYGSFVQEATAELTEDTLKITYSETSSDELPCTILSEKILSLYEEENNAYAIAYYEISGDVLKLNVLGATAEAVTGDRSVCYTDQQSTADITFNLDGTAVESNQVDVAGGSDYEDYAFNYCFYTEGDSMFMFVCIDDGYLAYAVELAEDGTTLNLTYQNAYTYDLQ